MIEHQDVNNINSYQTIISSINTFSFYQNYLAFQLISYIAIELSSSKNNYSTYFKLIPLFYSGDYYRNLGIIDYKKMMVNNNFPNYTGLLCIDFHNLNYQTIIFLLMEIIEVFFTLD